MIIKTLIEMYQGNLSLVQYVQYSSGQKIKRILDKNGVPQTIIKL